MYLALIYVGYKMMKGNQFSLTIVTNLPNLNLLQINNRIWSRSCQDVTTTLYGFDLVCFFLIFDNAVPGPILHFIHNEILFSETRSTVFQTWYSFFSNLYRDHKFICQVEEFCVRIILQEVILFITCPCRCSKATETYTFILFAIKTLGIFHFKETKCRAFTITALMEGLIFFFRNISWVDLINSRNFSSFYLFVEKVLFFCW